MHLNFDGNYALARAWAAAAERLLAPPATNAGTRDWASQEVCERRLALTPWNRCAVLEDVLHRLTQPPFTGQLHHSEQIESVRSQLRAIRPTLDRKAAADARQVCLAALERAPNDHRLHENTAEFLERTGDLQGAAAQWQSVVRIIPHHHVAYFQAGRLLARLGDLAAGRALIEQALKIRPDLTEGWLELGDIHAAQSQPELALPDYQRAMRLAPQDCRMYATMPGGRSRNSNAVLRPSWTSDAPWSCVRNIGRTITPWARSWPSPAKATPRAASSRRCSASSPATPWPT